MTTRADITAEVGLRFGQAVSLLVRGAGSEMAARGCTRQEASAVIRDALQFILERGPQPYGDKAEDPEQPQ
jgi:hypothetical protein